MSLPKGWAAATLAEIGAWGSGGTPKATEPTYYGGTIPWIRSGDLYDGEITAHTVAISEAGLNNSSAKWVEPGSVLVAMYGATIGKVGLTTYPITTNQAVAFVKPARGILARYILAYFRSEKSNLISLGQGGAQPNISQEIIKAQGISLPPAAEQRRIVAKLDALTARLARARAELDRVPVLAANYRATALADTYDRLDGEFSSVPIRDVIASLDQGWSPKCENFPTEHDDTWAVLKTTAIQALEFRPAENKVLPSDLTPRPRLRVEEGDVLVTRAGPRVRCGITCVVGKTPKRLMLADKMYRLRCKSDRAISGYLALMLNAPQILAMIEKMKTGISDSGLNLTQDKFLSLPIPSASLEQQSLVEANLQTAFARADRLEAEAAHARALLDRLESAILAKAFRGELVSQDPNDEPAQVLLDRIRAERAAAPKARRGRTAKVDA